MLLTVVAVGRGLYLRALPADASLSANQLIYDTLTRFLRGGGRTVAALGLIMVIVAVAVGPSRPAVKLRQLLSTGIGRVGDEAGAHGLNTGPIGPFVHRNLKALRGAVAALAVVVLVLSDRPSAGTVLWITVVAVATAVVLEVLARSSGPVPSTRTDDLDDQIRSAPWPAAGDNTEGGIHSATPATEPTT